MTNNRPIVRSPPKAVEKVADRPEEPGGARP